LFFNEKVPGIPANKNLFLTFSFPRLATIRLLDFELSGISRTGAPASISRRTREARCALSLTWKEQNFIKKIKKKKTLQEAGDYFTD